MIKLTNNSELNFKCDSNNNYFTKDDNIALGLTFFLIGILLGSFWFIMFSHFQKIRENTIFELHDFMWVAISIVVSLVGIRIMQTSTKMTISSTHIHFDFIKFFTSNQDLYEKDKFVMSLDKATIPNPNGIDWKGYGVSLLMDDHHYYLSTSKDQEKLRHYAQDLSDRTNIRFENKIA